MTIEIFFEKFDLFADVSDAVPKIRELVMQLAVQGKLVRQNSSEPSAIECIRQANEPLVKVAPDESVATPTGWVSLPLGCVIASNIGGGTPSKHNPDYWNGPIPWASVKDVRSDKYLVSTIDSITKAGLADSSSNLIPPNRLIVVTRMGLGKVAINTIPIAINQDLRAIEPTAALDLDFAYLLFKSLKIVGSGVTVKGITVNKLHSMPVLIPPLAEQKRIVGKVDELMKVCNRLESQQRERKTRHAALARASLARFADAPTSANFNLLFHNSYDVVPADLRNVILTLAVQGKLVPQSSADEPAGDCLSRLGLKSTLVNSDVGGPLPLSWCRLRFEDVAVTAGGVTLGRKLGERKTVTLPYLRVANVKRGEIDLDVVKQVSIAEDELERYALQKNDLLMIEGGDWDKVGRAAIWDGQIPVCLHQNHVFRSRMRSAEISPVWFQYYFNSPPGRRYFESASKQTTNLASINMRQVRSCPVPFPPLAEQQRIVAKVDELMVLIAKLETQIAHARVMASDLLEAMIADLAGIERKSKSLPDDHNSMKLNAARTWKARAPVEPLNLSTQGFILRRFKMESPYRSLAAFDCNYHLEKGGPTEASPICLVGLNGSGKSNLIEAIAEVFCFLELINLPWKKVESTSSRYRENRHRFELEYTIQDGKIERLVRIRKLKKSGAEFFICKNDGTEEPVAPGRDQLRLLPRRIIGYSSGLNETLSHPFLRTKTIYSEEVRDAAPPDGVSPPEDDKVFDTRTLYMDYESNAAILICNFMFGKQSTLAVIDEYTRVCGVSSFGLHFNRKRAGKSGLHSTVRLTGELHSYLKKFAYCAGQAYDETQICYDFSFKLTSEVKKRFRQEFKTGENLFMAMHKWSLLNALVLSDEQRKVYLRSDITKGALERPPSVPPSDRVFDIVDLKLNLSVPRIEIDYSGLSDGEHQFIQVFGTAMLFSEPGSLFLFDEPESHFNPEWRTRFNMILNALPNASRQEYVISTHSPFIVSGSRRSNVYKFERDGAKIKFGPVDFETYGASFDVLLKKIFSIESLIDQSARQDLEGIIKRGKEEEMQEAVETFAESKEKRRLYEALIKKEKI